MTLFKGQPWGDILNRRHTELFVGATGDSLVATWKAIENSSRIKQVPLRKRLMEGCGWRHDEQVEVGAAGRVHFRRPSSLQPQPFERIYEHKKSEKCKLPMKNESRAPTNNRSRRLRREISII